MRSYRFKLRRLPSLVSLLLGAPKALSLLRGATSDVGPGTAESGKVSGRRELYIVERSRP